MMDRSREARRVNNMAASNSLSRKRHRTGANSLRDSPDDDGQVELPETASGRLRDRVAGKKDRDGYRYRDRERERERERGRDRGDRERDRVMMLMMSNNSSRSKRRRADSLLVHQNHHHVGGHHFDRDDSSEESVNEDEDDDDDEDGLTMLPPHNPTNLSSLVSSSSSTFTSHPQSQHNHSYSHRKSLTSQPATPNSPLPPVATTVPPSNFPCKVLRSSPTSIAFSAVPPAFVPPHWASDEIIGVSVPRKARSASTKRPHDNRGLSSGGSALVSEQIHRHASSSPARSNGPGVQVVAASTSACAATAPGSPSSSNVAVKKRMRPNGPKQRPPKSSSIKSASSVQDEIEIEIAEVLYGLMRQPQGPVLSKPEGFSGGSDTSKIDNEACNTKSAGDAKSRVSSPVSNLQTSLPSQPYSMSVPSFSISPCAGASPISATAPKRKRPRPVKYDEDSLTAFPPRSSLNPSIGKVDGEFPVKVETSCSPKSVKAPVSGFGSLESRDNLLDTSANHGVLLSTREPHAPSRVEAAADSLVPLTMQPDAKEMVKKEEPRSPCAGPTMDTNRDSLRATKGSYTQFESETQRGEKFEIDLMVLPQVKSSPDRDGEIDFVAVGPKSSVTDVETPLLVKDEVKVVVHPGKEDSLLEREDKRTKATLDETGFSKQNAFKDKIIDLQLDLDKAEKEASLTKHQHIQKQHSQLLNSEKSAVPQNNSIPVPMSFAGWPGGIPHMGYMSPFQGVVSMDGNSLSSAALQPPPMLLNQQRPKRCATHYCIARNILCYQQLLRMNPFWPTAPASALPYGAKMNVLPAADLHSGRSGSSVAAEKNTATATLPAQSTKDKHSTPNSSAETAQRKQILIRQPLPPSGPSNILHSPAFIFSLSQQQAAAAAVASVRPGTVTSPAVGGGTPTSSSNVTPVAAAATGAVANAAAMNFNYPNMGSSETSYLAILQNGGYPIPVSAHMGSTPAYRGGAHPQPVPFYNGSFYPSQVLHPQLQQQQQPSGQSQQQNQRVHQNPIINSGQSSQKHLPSQQQKTHGTGMNLQSFPASKTHSSQAMQFPQQRQQSQNLNAPHQGSRPLDGEVGSEDSPSTAESRGSRTNQNVYGQNFVVPLHPPNFAFMSPAAIAGGGMTSNPSDKKQHHSQAQGAKPVVDSSPSQAFAVSFASINGASTAGFDMSSIAQNPALLQSLPEAARHGFHFMQAANSQSQQQKKSYRSGDEGKGGGNDCLNHDEDRKLIGGKVPAGSSIAFSRPDMADSALPSLTVNTVIDSSGRTHNLSSSTSSRASGSIVPSSSGNGNPPGPQLQRSQQQIIQQHQKHQQYNVSAPSGARGKSAATSNGNVYPDHVSSPSSVPAKFSNALTAFPPSIVQSSSAAQSSQWKNSVRSQVHAPSMASNSPGIKNLPQQQIRAPHCHTQISFGANPKSTPPQGQSNQSSNHSPPPLVVGSPTASISKSAGGSPRTASNSTNNKGGGHGSTPQSQQQTKNTGSLSQKSSVSLTLGHLNSAAVSANSSSKAQHSQQQQLPKVVMPASQIMYPSSFMQSSTTTMPTSGGFYLQRHRNEQPQTKSSASTSSTSMLSLCPSVTISNPDPAKAAASAGGLKGGAMSYAQFPVPQPAGKQHQLVPSPFPYAQPLPAAVQVKQADQKHPGE